METGGKVVSIDISSNKGMNKDTERFFNQAIELAAHGDFGEAINALHEVTKMNPTYTKAWAVKAMLYRLTGDNIMAELCTKTVNDLHTE